MNQNTPKQNIHQLLTFLFPLWLALSGFPLLINAQDDPYELQKYTFIKHEENHFAIYDTLAYRELFDKFTTIGLQGSGKVSIVHIGDSHIQADFLSGQFRRRLQTFFLGAMGGRGFIFPYKVAQTNNPLNYRVKSTGEWETCKNVDKPLNCKLGLSGISVTTHDTTASITIAIEDLELPGYDFDKLMVFHAFGPKTYTPQIKESWLVKKSTPNPELGYTLFEFTKNIDRVTLQTLKNDAQQDHFTLYGVNFGSNDPGIIYHTIGVNGATVESYLKCELFTPHLKALQPDWVIVSLGTNDVYTNVFDEAEFARQVELMIKNIKQAAPKTAILFSTPGDHRVKRIYANENTEKAASMIKQKAKEHKLSYWDFNYIMGGKGSVDYWLTTGMAHTDFLHYTQKGYEYQSKLLFNAFLRAYDAYFIDKMKNEN